MKILVYPGLVPSKEAPIQEFGRLQRKAEAQKALLDVYGVVDGLIKKHEEEETEKTKGGWSMFGKSRDARWAKVVEDLTKDYWGVERRRIHQRNRADELRKVVQRQSKEIQDLRHSLLTPKEEVPVQNPHRTKDGQHICECCGVVYVPTQGDGLWPLLNTVRLQGLWPSGKQYKKSTADLLLQPVHSGRFCPHCAEELQDDLDSVKYFLREDKADDAGCTALRRAVYASKNEKKEGKS